MNSIAKRSTAPIKHISTISAAILITFAGPAVADQGQAVEVQIAQLGVSAGTTPSDGNMVYIRVTPAPTVRGSCSTHTAWHFTLDVGTAFGKTAYPMLLEAFASGRTVAIYGTDTCYSAVELLRYLSPS